MNYRKAAEGFINTSFYLLDMYKHTPNAFDPNDEINLDGGYALRISKHGWLNIVDSNGKLISHIFNKAYSQITYVGKLLAVYLEHLQKDDS